jgi:mono/diheme cytochrome c family protein
VSHSRLAPALLAVLIAIGFASAWPLSAFVPQGAATEAGSLYTSEQAGRGESVYLDECARCHAEGLSGTEFGPALVGDEFLGKWGGKSVDTLYALVRETMPADGPGRLSGARTAEVLAFLLKANGVAPGPQALPSDVDALKTLHIPSSAVGGGTAR